MTEGGRSGRLIGALGRLVLGTAERLLGGGDVPRMLPSSPPEPEPSPAERLDGALARLRERIPAEDGGPRPDDAPPEPEHEAPPPTGAAPEDQKSM